MEYKLTTKALQLLFHTIAFSEPINDTAEGNLTHAQRWVLPAGFSVIRAATVAF